MKDSRRLLYGPHSASVLGVAFLTLGVLVFLPAKASAQQSAPKSTDSTSQAGGAERNFQSSSGCRMVGTTRYGKQEACPSQQRPGCLEIKVSKGTALACPPRAERPDSSRSADSTGAADGVLGTQSGAAGAMGVLQAAPASAADSIQKGASKPKD